MTDQSDDPTIDLLLGIRDATTQIAADAAKAKQHLDALVARQGSIDCRIDQIASDIDSIRLRLQAAPSLNTVAERLATLTPASMRLDKNLGLTPPGGGPEVCGPADYHSPADPPEVSGPADDRSPDEKQASEILDRIESQLPGLEELANRLLANVFAGSEHRRLQLDFPPHSMARLNALKAKTEAPSYAEVVKNALRIYEALIPHHEAGKTFLSLDKAGKTEVLKIFNGAP